MRAITKGKEKMGRNVSKTSLLVFSSLFFIFLFLNSVAAQPAVFDYTFGADSYIISYPGFGQITQGEDFTFEWYVSNASTGIVLNDTNLICRFQIYQNNGGGRLIEIENINIIDEYGDFSILVAGGNFTEAGTYSKSIICQDDYYGASSFELVDVIPGQGSSSNPYTYVVIFTLLSFLLLLFGIRYEVKILVYFASILILLLGLYTFNNGFGYYRDTMSFAFSWICWGLGLATMLDASMNWD